MPLARIVGTGSFFPEARLTNADLERMVDTNDSWIVERTGIHERRILGSGLATSDMATHACQAALEMATCTASDIDLIVVATVTPDMFCPSAAVRIQEKLGALNACAFDISAACAGSLLALDIAACAIETGRSRCAVVIGAETMSRIINYQDRNTCILFGDAAGAMLLKASSEEERGILKVLSHTDGRRWDLIQVPAGGSLKPGKDSPAPEESTVHMAGREVFKFAVRALVEISERILREANISSDDVKWVVAHQANTRILEALSQRVGIPYERFVINIEWTGNTSSASVPTTLDCAVRDGRIQEGDIVLMLAIGAGMAWAASLVRW